MGKKHRIEFIWFQKIEITYTRRSYTYRFFNKYLPRLQIEKNDEKIVERCKRERKSDEIKRTDNKICSVLQYCTFHWMLSSMPNQRHPFTHKCERKIMQTKHALHVGFTCTVCTNIMMTIEKIEWKKLWKKRFKITRALTINFVHGCVHDNF